MLTRQVSESFVEFISTRPSLAAAFKRFDRHYAGAIPFSRSEEVADFLANVGLNGDDRLSWTVFQRAHPSVSPR